MGFFGALKESGFKTDKQGRQVYFPHGMFGRGRIVTDEKVKDQLGRIQLIGVCVVVAIGYVLLKIDMWMALLFFAAFIVLHKSIIHYKVRGYAFSDEKLGWVESFSRRSVALGKGWIVTALIVSLLLSVGSLAATIGAGQPIGIFVTIVFGAIAAAYGWMLRLYKRATSAPERIAAEFDR